MIFELVSGVFYSFNSGSNCWTKLAGVDSLGLATPLANGLMSKDDFKKLQDLIIPPPQSTIRGEECNATFRSGTVALYSFDDSIDIKNKLDIVNPAMPGEDRTDPWSIHRNTAGFDFGLPLNRIIQEIEDRNKFKKTQLEGDKGAKGERGDPGEDKVDTGPVGPVGVSGANSSFAGTLATESIPFELVDNDSNRAIVEVTTEEISESENFLVVKRANIGNPDACPSLILPTDFQSPLIVALNTIVGGKLVRNQQINSGDCALVCRICSSSIHHLNIEPLLSQVHDRFLLRIDQLKSEKEALVRAWLNTMVSLFSEQKAALCCALENCQSRKRNERTRQFIEVQRIQAAQADFNLIIDGKENRVDIEMDSFKDCPVPSTAVDAIVPFEGGVTFCLDSKIHVKDPRTGNPAQSLCYFLPAGSYQAEIIDCCANFNDSAIANAYSGRAAILHRKVTQVGSNRSVTLDTSKFPNLGVFENEAAGKNAYLGLTLTFEHDGGDVCAWLLDSDGFIANNDGKVIIRIVDLATLGTATEIDPATGTTFIYRNDIAFNNLMGSVLPFAGGISAVDNFGALPGEVDLTVGPTLVKDQASVFLYDGSDGLSLFFVAGEQPAAGNAQQANIQLQVEITNNTFPLTIRALDSETDVIQTSPGVFSVTMSIDGDSAGFVIGEIDPTANYSITITPTNLSTMRTWIAADPTSANNVVLAEGGSEGIGGNISVIQLNSAPLFDIETVPESFGGGNSRGLQVRNQIGGHDVTITRPIDLIVPDAFNPPTVAIDPIDGELVSLPIPSAPVQPSAPVSQFFYTRPNKAWFGPGSTGALPTGKLHATPICEQRTLLNCADFNCNQTFPTVGTSGPFARIVSYNINTGEINDPENPVSVNYFTQAPDAACPEVPPAPVPTQPPTITIIPGDTSTPVAVPEEEVPPAAGVKSALDIDTTRGAPGSPQDPCVLEICLTIRTDVIQSLRTILTDKSGIKYYSAFSTTDPAVIGSFQNMALGGPIKILNSPPEFSPAVINSKTIDVSLMAGKLTTEQIAIANNLTGITRLTFIQELIGQPIDAIPNANEITDIEIQFQNMSVSTVDVGIILVKVGLPGAITEIVIDDFEAPPLPPIPEPDLDFTGEIKRVVATKSGTDSLSSGLIYSGIDNYFGDYVGFDTFTSTGVDFNGNNFFTLNTAGPQKVTQITAARGFGDLKTGAITINTVSGNVTGDAIAVDSYGVVYIADGSRGEVYAVFAQNAQILNTTHGDAHDQGSQIILLLASGLPTTSNPVITLGERKMVGANLVHELIVNFGGQWFRIDSAEAVFFPGGAAARADLTTPRCCFGGNPPGFKRIQAVFPSTRTPVSLGSGPGGNSVDTSADVGPQPSLPTDVNNIGPLIPSIQAELDAQFNQFEFFSVDGTNLYRVSLPGGSRTLVRDLGENAFGVRVNPITKDVYYIVDNRGTSPSSGTVIKRVDIDNLDGDGFPKIKTVYTAEGQEGVFGITFGVSVPTDPTVQNQVLYALLSTLITPGSGASVNVRLVEVAERFTPAAPDDPSSVAVPTNSVWVSTVSSGGLPGNPDTVILTKLTPGSSCQMHYKQVQWYERGWRIGACCGALVEEGGVDYLVVKRSIGTDISCGGGESETTICISQFVETGQGHPAIAWPAVPVSPDDGMPGGNGEEFLGIPTSGFVNFVKDEALSTALLNKIQSNDIIRKIGRPELNIPFILFPSTT